MTKSADLWRVVERLAHLEVDSSLTDEHKQEVIDVLVQEGCDYYDFQDLDEKPGRFGYKVDGKEWHYKLRQVRNDPSAKLFERLSRGV
jgi:hypothetical protein